MPNKSSAEAIDKIADRSTILIPAFSLGDVAGGSVKHLHKHGPVETADQHGDTDFHPAGSRHTLQFYENEDFLAQTVSELSGRHILIVDDDPDTREILSYVLNEAGAVVRTAE